jgi:hypothetical protein
MSYTALELFDSRKIDAGTDTKTIQMLWVVYGGDDASEQDIYNYVCSPSGPGVATPLAPYTMDGLTRNDIKFVNKAGPGGIWYVDATYGTSPIVAGLDVQDTFPTYGGLDAPLTIAFSGDITGKSLHITQGVATIYRIQGGGADVIASGTNATVTSSGGFSLDGSPSGLAVGQQIVIGPGQGITPGIYTITSVGGSTVVVTPTPQSNGNQTGSTGISWTVYSANVANPAKGGSATDFGNAINVSLDGVAGCDIIVPTLEWGLEGVISPFTMRDLQVFYQLVGKLNFASFWSFQPSEVLMQGASFKFIDNIACRVAMKFACQPNAYNLFVTPTITAPFKAGWDYLWVYYLPGVSTTTPTIPIQIAQAAYVVQVYQYGDFGTLQVT